MQRRRFLQAMAAAAAAWAVRARGDTSASAGAGAKPSGTPFTERGHLREALARARKRGVPLFVIVIPASDDEKLERGSIFGEFLDHGSEDQLEPLSQAELVCAPADELREVASVAGEPLFAVVQPNGAVTAAPAAFPRHDKGWGRQTDSESVSLVDKRIAFIAAHVDRTLPRPLNLSKSMDGHVITVQLRAHAPLGSHWARQSMCGGPTVDDLPDDPSGMPDCGMGHVPKKSERFLYFFSRSPFTRLTAR
jgi:hypothetical protein